MIPNQPNSAYAKWEKLVVTNEGIVRTWRTRAGVCDLGFSSIDSLIPSLLVVAVESVFYHVAEECC